MATSDGQTDSDGMTWDGYTDYQQVAGRVASEIQDATAAAAMLQRAHVEGGQYDVREIAEATSRIVSAAYLLEEQMAIYRDTNEELDKILDDWRGEGDETGTLDEFEDCDFYDDTPPWLHTFIQQLNRAGHELGYLKAGREEALDDHDGDPDDAEVMDVIEAMTI